MKLLFVTSHVPDAPTDGIKIVSYNLIRLLKQHCNYTIDLVVFAGGEMQGDSAPVAPYCRSVQILPLRKQSKVAKIINLFKRTPNQLLKYYDDAAHKSFREKVAGERYDLVYVMPLEVWQYVADMKVPRVLNTLDAHSLREWRRFQFESVFSFKKYYSLLRYVKMLRYEKFHYPKSDCCILVSGHDVSYLQKHKIPARFEVMQNGVDADYFDPAKVIAPTSDVSLVFTGDYQYRPNERAAIYLYEKIYLRLKKNMPHLRLYIVGKNPTSAMRKIMQDPETTLTGYVDDIRYYLKIASVFVCPLSFGAGIKNKILEAVSMRVPVVCSRFSVCGLEALETNGLVNVVEQDTDYIKKITGILNNPEQQMETGERGRQFVLRSYTWQAVAEKVDRLAGELQKGF